jgi:hypothetical protein
VATKGGRTRRALLLGTLALVAVGLTAAAVTLTITYFHRRFGTTDCVLIALSTPERH